MLSYHRQPADRPEIVEAVKACRARPFKAPDCYAPGEKERRTYVNGCCPPRIPGTNLSPAFNHLRLFDHVTVVDFPSPDGSRLPTMYPPGTLNPDGTKQRWYHKLQRAWCAWRIRRKIKALEAIVRTYGESANVAAKLADLRYELRHYHG